ncbi:hypothetical protein [Cohnella sp.]
MSREGEPWLRAATFLRNRIAPGSCAADWTTDGIREFVFVNALA